MPTPTIPAGNLFMNATLYTGNNTSQTITNGAAGASFQPDFVWIKSRSTAANNVLSDSVRGVSKWVISDTTDAELSGAGYIVTAFNSNGFNVGLGTSANQPAGTTFVGWQWKAGSTAVTNTAGNRTSQVSANTTSGFSVSTYTFTSSGTNTIGHGLGVAPSFILMRDLTTSGYNWDVYHASLGYTQRLILNSSGGATSTFWAAAPTSTVFSVTSGCYSNNDNVVAYCWAPIAGYSAFGSYTGNGSSDGPFVYCGFRPRWIMIKSTGTANSWHMTDTSRSTYNQAVETLWANETTSESTSSTQAIDILSNGFKIRNSTNEVNASGGTLIYAAFAENPFKYANAR